MIRNWTLAAVEVLGILFSIYGLYNSLAIYKLNGDFILLAYNAAFFFACFLANLAIVLSVVGVVNIWRVIGGYALEEVYFQIRTLAVTVGYPLLLGGMLVARNSDNRGHTLGILPILTIGAWLSGLNQSVVDSVTNMTRGMALLIHLSLSVVNESYWGAIGVMAMFLNSSTLDLTQHNFWRINPAGIRAIIALTTAVISMSIDIATLAEFVRKSKCSFWC